MIYDIIVFGNLSLIKMPDFKSLHSGDFFWQPAFLVPENAVFGGLKVKTEEKKVCFFF